MSHLAWWNKPVTAAGEIEKTEKSQDEGNNSYFSLISKNLWLLNGGDDNDKVSKEIYLFMLCSPWRMTVTLFTVHVDILIFKNKRAQQNAGILYLTNVLILSPPSLLN